MNCDLRKTIPVGEGTAILLPYRRILPKPPGQDQSSKVSPEETVVYPVLRRCLSRPKETPSLKEVEKKNKRKTFSPRQVINGRYTYSNKLKRVLISMKTLPNNAAPDKKGPKEIFSIGGTDDKGEFVELCSISCHPSVQLNIKMHTERGIINLEEQESLPTMPCVIRTDGKNSSRKFPWEGIKDKTPSITEERVYDVSFFRREPGTESATKEHLSSFKFDGKMISWFTVHDI